MADHRQTIEPRQAIPHEAPPLSISQPLIPTYRGVRSRQHTLLAALSTQPKATVGIKPVC